MLAVLRLTVTEFYIAALAGLAVCAVASSACAQTAGDWVLARYKGGEHLYPGILKGTNGDRATVAYDDGDRETLSLSQVRPYTWAIGGRVECNYQGGGKWYPGRIASLSGTSIGIKYDDGDSERTTTGRCRSQ